MTNQEASPVIGIDLGTTYSAVAVRMGGKTEVIPSSQGNRTIPSYVAFTDKEFLSGESAKAQSANNPENTVFDAKRLIGRNFDDHSVQNDMKHWPFSVTKSEAGKCLFNVTYKGEQTTYHPEQISAIILANLRDAASAYLGTTVTDAVVTVPAYFNDAQRQATKDAGRIAGLNVLRVINEPTAAAVAYGIDKKEEDQNILVFDLGGGTFDVSILNIADGIFEVLSTNGDTHLGGEDMDNRMVDYMVEVFSKNNRGKDLRSSGRSLRRLRTACERAKRTLSSATTANIEIDALFEGIDFYTSITRAKFQSLCEDLFQSCMEPVEKCLRDAKLDKNSINEVVLVGGSTRIPRVQELLQNLFNGKPLNKGINPDEAVACGAAIQAAIMSKNSEQQGEAGLILDVTSLSLGVAVQGVIMENLVDRNTTIPAKASKSFTTGANGQTAVNIKIYEGERKMVKDNNLLGEFNLEGIKSAPAGTPQIEVSFDVDANGILKVSAVDKASGKNEMITITNDGARHSQKDIDAMVAEAEKFKEEDEKRKAEFMARNDLEMMMMRTQTMIQSLPEEDKTVVTELLNETQEWLDDTTVERSVEDYTLANKTLSEKLAPYAQKMNEATMPGGEGTGLPEGMDMDAMKEMMKGMQGQGQAEEPPTIEELD